MEYYPKIALQLSVTDHFSHTCIYLSLNPFLVLLLLLLIRGVGGEAGWWGDKLS